METEYAWADQNARTDSIEAMPFGFQLRLPTMRSQFALDASSAGAVLANSLSVRDDSAAGAAVGEVPLDDLQRKERIEKRLMAIETAFFEDYGRPTDQASREGLARFMFLPPDGSAALVVR
ncbi:hypothetical protein OKW38_004688 [Paraburkholderia sp. MM5496-R1]|uniref:hypothetical protein n=1 Tax=Paraburkholderia sp. MM5496-R1 TaxID=2991065 RepID=UPI003D253F0E